MPSIARRNSAMVSADSLRPSMTQSIPSRSMDFVWVICQLPEPPRSTRNDSRCGLPLIASNSFFA